MAATAPSTATTPKSSKVQFRSVTARPKWTFSSSLPSTGKPPMLPSPSKAMRQCLVTDHQIRLLQEARREEPNLDRQTWIDIQIDRAQALYDDLTSLWGQAIAATPTFLPRLRRRLVVS